MYQRKPDDPFITEMDPVQKMWMFNNWAADQNDEAELAKNHAYLLASFWNPEAVQQILGTGGGSHQSTDDEFEESLRMVKDQSIKLQQEENKPIRKRRRHLVKKD